MSIFNFIKENRVLVAGLVLPLLLIGFLAIARAIPATITEPPQYKVVYYSQAYSGLGTFTPKIKDGKLDIGFNKTPQNNYPSANQNSTIMFYLYDPATKTVKNTSVNYDDISKPETLKKFASAKFSDQLASPDGYNFEAYRSRNYSLLTDIFGGGGYRSSSALTKNGVSVDIPIPTPWNGDTQFLGWITEGDVTW